MPLLDSALFPGANSDISETDIQNCEARNSGEAINDILTDYGWEGKPTGGILLHLSPDNARIAAGTFFYQRGGGEGVHNQRREGVGGRQDERHHHHQAASHGQLHLQ